MTTAHAEQFRDVRGAWASAFGTVTISIFALASLWFRMAMRTNVEELGKNLQPDGKFNILARRLRLRCELALKASPAKHCLWS